MGVHHEETAIEEYEVSKGVSVMPSGLWLSASGLIGACPDGLVGHDWAIEIKYPYSVSSTTLLEWAKDKKPFFLALPHPVTETTSESVGQEQQLFLNLKDATG